MPTTTNSGSTEPPATPGRLLLDANVLLRVSDSSHEHHADCMALLRRHRRSSIGLTACSQTYIEYYVVLTRPKDRNGFSYTPGRAWRNIDALRKLLDFAGDRERTFVRWRRLVLTRPVRGKAAHDAKYVALAQAHGIGRVVTYNVDDFKRYDEVEVVTPPQLLAEIGP